MKARKILALIMSVCLIFTACIITADADSSRDDINLAINQVIESLNPFFSNTITGQQLYFQLYETLFFYNDAGEFEPRIAESYTIEDDNVTYIVKIKDGIKFQNGDPVTAEDAAFSLNFNYKDGPYTALRSKVPAFESARAIDDTTLEIKSNIPDSSFFASVCISGYILNKKLVEEAEAAGNFGLEWIPCGTGPYVVESYNPDTKIVLKAFPDYYRGEARIKTVNYQILIDNNTTTIAFEGGDLDYIVVPTAAWSRISSNPDYTTFLSPTNHTSFFFINTHRAPLDNKLVRQAISYGTDREAMCFVAYDGIATPATSYFNPVNVAGSFTPEELAEAGIPYNEYNPQKAKELLAEAGYPDGVDIGTILCINGSYWEKMSTVFQDNMKDIGVTVAIELADSAACRARRKVLDYDLATTGDNYTPDAGYVYTYVRYNTDDELGTTGTQLGLQNMELEEALLKAKSTMDETERRAAYLEVNRILQDEQYILNTFHKAIPYAYNKNLICDEINTNYYYIYNFHWN